MAPLRFEPLSKQEVNDMFWKHANLNFVMSMFPALIICGCSTVQTSDLPPAELQDQIATGQLIKPGDRVTVTTIQGMEYDLEITRVTENSIEGQENVPEHHQQIDENANISLQTVHGESVEIPVAEISAIETRELTPLGKGAAATGAVVAVGGMMYFMYFLLPTLLVSAVAGL
jgi:hypothetical protein